jgi:hypothetical protein
MSYVFPALVSFAYYARRQRDQVIADMTVNGQPPYLIGDSGAFTARTQGKPVQLNEYAAWVIRWGDTLSHYANLDIIGDDDASWENQKLLEAEGLHPFPVFHGGSSWATLYRYLEAGYPYLAVGGLVGVTGEVARWLADVFTRCEGRAVLHGFGMTRWPIIRDFPFFSVDSSAWGSGYRYGLLRLWNGDLGKFVSVKVGDDSAYKHGDLCRAHGLEPAQVADRDQYHQIYMRKASATAWARASMWLRERMPPVKLEGSPDGPHIHLVDAGDGLPVAARAYARVARLEGVA